MAKSKLKSYKILVVDDDISMREALTRMLEKGGYEIQSAPGGKSALNLYTKDNFDLVISDIMMPEIKGVELLRELKKIDKDAKVIFITGYATVETAVQAIRIGAEDYFTKPFKNVEVLKVVDRLYQNKMLVVQNEKLKQQVLKNNLPEMVGHSPELMKVISEINLVATSDLAVFVSGESGTGKELVARAIHNLSNRKDEPFVAINCAAIPADLLESELFGHEKGAFSGAIARKYGLFEIADKGTLFLDEIMEMPIALQAKLLRIIETKRVRRIGGTSEYDIDFRIVCCSNRDIKIALAENNFREDLFYRLSSFQIVIPPLRERKSDIPILVKNYLQKKNAEKINIPKKLMSIIKSYNWPGNVRELQHVLDRLILYSTKDLLSIRHLPKEMTENRIFDNFTESADTNIELKSMSEIEREQIFKTLEHCKGDKKEAAQILGIGLKTLYRKIAEYN